MKQYYYKKDLLEKIDEYFSKTISNLSSAKIVEHPTITGLAIHLGFESKEEFDLYESVGLFKNSSE
ncbi:hypothetical protein [Mucilaginibacter antarcticus]|uniref:hypothetical protein n=1 Tax=Mucilaginibacter antarcticus TaxID=1855725 RepID=UPI003639173C